MGHSQYYCVGHSRSGSALLAVYQQWCSLSCGFPCGSVACVRRGGYLLPGLIGFCVCFHLQAGVTCLTRFANGFVSGIGGALCVPVVLPFVA